MMIESAKKISTYKLHGVKIHSLCLLKNTKLARIYVDSPFPILEKDEYILVLDHEPNSNAHRELLEKFRKRMELEHPHVQYEIINYNRCIKKL